MLLYTRTYNFLNFQLVHWCNWCYKCRSKLLKQYQYNWCHKSWLMLIECQMFNVPMFKCSNVQMFKFINIQMFKCLDVQMFISEYIWIDQNKFEYLNIWIYWLQIFIRTFVRFNFSFANIFGHSFVLSLFERIYSDIRSWVC